MTIADVYMYIKGVPNVAERSADLSTGDLECS